MAFNPIRPTCFRSGWPAIPTTRVAKISGATMARISRRKIDPSPRRLTACAGNHAPATTPAIIATRIHADSDRRRHAYPARSATPAACAIPDAVCPPASHSTPARAKQAVALSRNRSEPEVAAGEAGLSAGRSTRGERYAGRERKSNAGLESCRRKNRARHFGTACARNGAVQYCASAVRALAPSEHVENTMRFNSGEWLLVCDGPEGCSSQRVTRNGSGREGAHIHSEWLVPTCLREGS